MEDIVIGIGGRANIKAAGGDYKGAVAILNAGIEKYPMEARFWNNRCFFYSKRKEYKKALEDANEMVRKFPSNLKSYFRKGEALVGLKLYKEAEQAFNQVLERSRLCQEATEQILEIKVLQIMELGFSRMHAQEALACSANLEEAIQFAKENKMTCGMYGDVIYHSDDDEFDDEYDDEYYSTDGRSKYQIDKFMDPANPRGIQSLWVGNVEDITEEELKKLFSGYGKIASMSMLEAKRCAFINFTDAKAAGLAMKALQDKRYHGANNQASKSAFTLTVADMRNSMFSHTSLCQEIPLLLQTHFLCEQTALVPFNAQLRKLFTNSKLEPGSLCSENFSMPVILLFCDEVRVRLKKRICCTPESDIPSLKDFSQLRSVAPRDSYLAILNMQSTTQQTS